MKKGLIIFSTILVFLLALSISVSAKVYVTSYCDVSLEACRAQDQALELLVDKYPYDIEVEYLYYFDIYDAESSLAQNALECAKRQGYKEEYKAELQNNLEYLSRDALKEYAATVGLVAANFSFCLDTQMTAWDVLTEVVAAEDDGVTSAPSVRFNMDIYTGSQTFTSLHELTKQYLGLDGEEEEKSSEWIEEIEEQITIETTEEIVEEEEITVEQQPLLEETEEPLFFRVIAQFRAWLLGVFNSN